MLHLKNPPKLGLSTIIPQISGGVSTASIVDTSAASEDKPQYTRKNPFPAKLLVNRLLTASDSSKETRHYEISIAGSGLHYEAGDALGIFASNCPKLVDALLNAIHCSGAEEEAGQMAS